MHSSILCLLALAIPALSIPQDELGRLSPATLEQIKMFSDEHITSTTVSVYPISIFALWLLMYFSAQLVEYLFYRYTVRFRKMSFANQRTSVMYVLNVFYTTGAFAIQMACYGFFRSEYTVWNIRCLRVVASLVTSLYLFELTYRVSMRLQMLTHHLSTVFAIMFVNGAVVITQDPSMFLTALMWLFQATTEQGIFVGLLMYRFKLPVRIVPPVLKYAAIQALLVKFVFCVYTFAWWGVAQARHTSPMEVGFSVVLVFALSLLTFTQFYGAWVVWKLANTYEGKYFDEADRTRGNSPAMLESGNGRVSTSSSSTGKVPVLPEIKTVFT
ncbi:hypothetical protein T439DRAFT_217998 [Meredithblackwellia eburnea MCA 4105]